MNQMLGILGQQVHTQVKAMTERQCIQGCFNGEEM